MGAFFGNCNLQFANDVKVVVHIYSQFICPKKKISTHNSEFTGVLPKYFSSEWSVAQFRLHEGLQHIVAFGQQKNTILIVGMDGRYLRNKLCFYIILISFIGISYWKYGLFGLGEGVLCDG